MYVVFVNCLPPGFSLRKPNGSSSYPSIWLCGRGLQYPVSRPLYFRWEIQGCFCALRTESSTPTIFGMAWTTRNMLILKISPPPQFIQLKHMNIKPSVCFMKAQNTTSSCGGCLFCCCLHFLLPRSPRVYGKAVGRQCIQYCFVHTNKGTHL